MVKKSEFAISFKGIENLPTIGSVKKLDAQVRKLVVSPKAPKDKIVDKIISKRRKK